MKYLVMECHPSYAVVLDQEGRFLKVANMRYQPGQTVSQVVRMDLPQAAKKPNRRWLYSLSAVAACLVLLVTAVWMGHMPYASVYLTINPEVRIDVNRSDVVVGLEGVNQDGQDLIAGYEYRKKDLDIVMDELVDLAIEMGYLHAGGQINLTLEASDQGWVVNHSDALPEHLNTYLTDKLTVTILVEELLPGEKFQSGSDYHTSDYGASDYSQTVVIPDGTEPQPSDSNVSDDGQTDYGVSDYQQTTSPKPVQTEPEDSPYEGSDDDNDYDDDPGSDYD